MIEIIIIAILIVEFITLEKKYNSKKTLKIRIISLVAAVVICLVFWLTTKMMSIGSLLVIVIAVPILLALSIVRYYKNSGSGSNDPWKIMLKIIRGNFMYRAEKDAQNTDALCELLLKNKIIHFLNIDKSKNLPQKILDAAEKARIENRQKKNSTEEFLADLNDFAAKKGLNYAVIKGVAFDERIYDGKGMRSFGDIDLLINEADAVSFHEFLLEKGYVQHIGVTSIPKANSTRAVMALNASKANIVEKEKQPIKAVLKMSEYSPYHCDGKLPVELHTGIYFLDNKYIPEMINNAIVLEGKKPYKALNLADTFIVLLLTAYENSEATSVNLYDRGMNLRDYVDIKMFFDKYKKINIWDDITDRIRRYGIEKYVGIILHNLKEVYEEDITEGYFYSITMRKSEWDMSLLERMSDPEKTAKNTWKILRKYWDAESSGNLYKVKSREAGGLTDTNSLMLDNNVKFNIEQADDTFILNWIIPNDIYEQRENFLFQCRFFPLAEGVMYSILKADFGFYENEWKAFARQTMRLRSEAIKKETGKRLDVETENCGDFINVKVNVPYSCFGFPESLISTQVCMSVGVYEKYYGVIYRLGGGNRKLMKYKIIKILKER